MDAADQGERDRRPDRRGSRRWPMSRLAATREDLDDDHPAAAAWAGAGQDARLVRRGGLLLLRLNGARRGTEQLPTSSRVDGRSSKLLPTRRKTTSRMQSLSSASPPGSNSDCNAQASKAAAGSLEANQRPAWGAGAIQELADCPQFGQASTLQPLASVNPFATMRCDMQGASCMPFCSAARAKAPCANPRGLLLSSTMLAI